MSSTVGVNKKTVVHKKSKGKSIAFPDVCKTKVGSSVVPIPYTNTAISKDMENGARTVTADGQPLGHEESFFSKSTGDEAGSKKGVNSGTVADKAEFVNFSFDVEVEGKGVVRAMDQMIHNNANTPVTYLNQPPLDQEILDEPIEIPEQNKIEVRFTDPFEQPMNSLEVNAEADNEKQIKETMANGQVFHITEAARTTIKLENKNLDLKEQEQ